MQFPEIRFVEIAIKILLCGVVNRHLMVFAAFFMESKPVALALGEIVSNLHPEHGTDAGKAKKHRGDEDAFFPRKQMMLNLLEQSRP